MNPVKKVNDNFYTNPLVIGVVCVLLVAWISKETWMVTSVYEIKTQNRIGHIIDSIDAKNIESIIKAMERREAWGNIELDKSDRRFIQIGEDLVTLEGELERTRRIVREVEQRVIINEQK